MAIIYETARNSGWIAKSSAVARIKHDRIFFKTEKVNGIILDKGIDKRGTQRRI